MTKEEINLIRRSLDAGRENLVNPDVIYTLCSDLEQAQKDIQYLKSTVEAAEKTIADFLQNQHVVDSKRYRQALEEIMNGKYFGVGSAIWIAQQALEGSE